MKISKTNIVKSFKQPLSNIGFRYIEDTTTVAKGLFYKRINNEYILTLGFVISKFGSGFTASYYLSKTFEFGFIPGDFPHEAYQRISVFLEKNEKNGLIEEPWVKNGLLDAWWSDLSKHSIDCIIDVIKITEHRFLNQSNLFEMISSSLRLQNHLNMLKKVQGIVTESSDIVKINTLSSHPINVKYNIPIEWYQAAEQVLSNERPLEVTPKFIEFIAIESWRLYNIS